MAIPARPFSRQSPFRERARPGRALAGADGDAGGAYARFAAWIRRRRGADPTSFVLHRRRIYILPTRFGIAFGCVLFAMLLGSINYGASLGYALTFLLAGLGLAMLHQCHANLLGIEVGFAGAAPVFAGGDARFRIRLSHSGGAPRYEIGIGAGGREFGPVDVPPGDSAVLAFAVPAARRGRLAAPRFSISTRHPGALFRAWTYAHMDIDCIVYPEPAPPGMPPPVFEDDRGGRRAKGRGDTDFAGLRAAVPGDPPRRIAWKAYARTDELLLKQFSGGTSRVDVLDYEALAGKPAEERLSLIARWCIDAAADGRSFGLRLPGDIVPVGTGERHLHRCLEALALFPQQPGEAPER